MEALVLARKDIREYDQTITLFTKEQGKLQLLTRGIKKITSKNAATLQHGALVDVDIAPGKQVDYITKAYPITLFPHIRRDVEKSLVAQHALHQLSQVVEVGKPEDAMFNLVMSLLHQLEEVTHVSPLYSLGFTIKLFSLLGFTPVLDSCVVTGGGTIAGFSPKEGGAIAPSVVTEKRSYKEEVITCTKSDCALLATLLQRGWSDIAKLEVPQQQITTLTDIIYGFTQFHTTRRLARPIAVV